MNKHDVHISHSQFTELSVADEEIWLITFVTTVQNN